MREILGLIYFIATDLRNWAFNVGILKSKKVSVPVISVGNLTSGGTGKSPMVIFLAEIFKRHGKKVVVVSRGYGGANNKPVARVDATALKATGEFGDEPVLISELTGVPVYVGKKRTLVCEEVVSQVMPDVIICDDAYQHRYLSREVDILLLDSSAPVSSYKALPVGRLRERFKNFKRADFIFSTKENLITNEQKNIFYQFLSIKGIYPEQNNFFKFEYRLSNLTDSSTLREVSLDELNSGFGLISGIGNPIAFSRSMEGFTEGLKPAFVITKGDHHDWSINDVNEIARKARDSNVKYIVTTKKDEVKLRQMGTSSMPFTLVVANLEVTPKASSEEIYERLAAKVF